MVVTRRSPHEIAVVGGGISGLTCARTLARAGFPVRVFDKARGPGGRASTRRTEWGTFDHGAQYFTVKDPEFQVEVETWLELGVAEEWTGRIACIEKSGKILPVRGETLRYVGIPGMSAIGRFLIRGIEYRPETRVHSLVESPEGWSLRFAAGEAGPFAHVVLAMPPSQVQDLAPDLSGDIGTVTMEPCWALMFTLRRNATLDFDGAFIEGPVLSWAARNRSKPGRSDGETWVIHAGGAWSSQQIDSTHEEVQKELISAAREYVGFDPADVTFAQPHLWRYARPVDPLPRDFVICHDRRLSAAGDWCRGSRIEGAFLSGLKLGRELVQQHGEPGDTQKNHDRT